ncbi:hypothetical protein D3C78_1385560 [compost metagenome]
MSSRVCIWTPPSPREAPTTRAIKAMGRRMSKTMVRVMESAWAGEIRASITSPRGSREGPVAMSSTRVMHSTRVSSASQCQRRRSRCRWRVRVCCRAAKSFMITILKRALSRGARKG